MEIHSTRIPWRQPGWHEQAQQWILAELERLGARPEGPTELLQERPWSIILRVPSSLGVLFFKANIPALRHEAALTRGLWRWRPNCIPEPITVDVERGWMILPDYSPTLRSRIQAGEGIEHWQRALPVYADFQRSLIPRVKELLSLGAIDRRLAILPALYERLLDDTPLLHLDQPNGLDQASYQRLRDLVPHFNRQCERLAGMGVPETLHHDDFHDGNIFIRDDNYLFFDWAESCLTHPFFSLVVGLRSIAYRFGLDETAPEMVDLRDCYLSGWTEYGSSEHLVEAFHLAQRVGRVNRALTWHLVVSNLDPADQEKEADAVPGWLLVYLEGEEQAGN